jgi:RNA polymerase sigma factor (sigma-70 family)
MIDDKTYRKWLNFSKIITGNPDIAGDILNDVLIKLITSNISPDKLNDFYVFRAIKNTFFTSIRNNRIKVADNSSVEALGTILEDYEYERDQDEVDMLESIKNVVLSLDEYEQNLYKLVYLYGLSEREVARRSGINHRTINNRMLKIKLKITEYHNSKYN